MVNLQENIFIVGPVASGDSFFGRLQQIEELEETIFAGVGSRNLIGPTRIGKTSLVNRVFERNRDYPNRLCVQMNMGSCDDAYDFWTTLASEIEEQIRNVDLWNPEFERYYRDLWDKATPQNERWWTVFKGQVKKIMMEVREQGYRLVLSIDEFDSVEKIFAQMPHYYQLLRSFYSEPAYATSGVLISRRRLHLFEATCPYISTFHGVFPEMALLPFSTGDMEVFYDNLNRYGIILSPDGKERLEYYTGNMPYMCCMFGQQAVAHRKTTECYGDQEINAVIKRCLPQINRHYDDLIARLEEDNHLQFIFYLSIDSKCPNITRRDIENMAAMGILIPKHKDGSSQYYAFSQDFMAYLRMRPLKLPVWESMTSSEMRIKAIFQQEFPKLAAITYQTLIGDDGASVMSSIDAEYPELHLNWHRVRGYCENLSAHKDCPTVIDVLTLSKVIDVMLNTWDSRFYRYFSGDENWKFKLGEIKKLRNPLAHAQLEYIDEKELAICMKYCDEIIHMEC